MLIKHKTVLKWKYCSNEALNCCWIPILFFNQQLFYFQSYCWRTTWTKQFMGRNNCSVKIQSVIKSRLAGSPPSWANIFSYKHFGSPSRINLSRRGSQGPVLGNQSMLERWWLGQSGQLFSHRNAPKSWLSWEGRMNLLPGTGFPHINGV